MLCAAQNYGVRSCRISPSLGNGPFARMKGPFTIMMKHGENKNRTPFASRQYRRPGNSPSSRTSCPIVPKNKTARPDSLLISWRRPRRRTRWASECLQKRNFRSSDGLTASQKSRFDRRTRIRTCETDFKTKFKRLNAAICVASFCYAAGSEPVRSQAT